LAKFRSNPSLERPRMNEKLLSALADLSARKYGSDEGNQVLASFMKKTMKLQATFVSNQRTYNSRYDKSYVDGQTILAQLGASKLEVGILIHPDSNWKEDHKPVLPLSQGDVFEIEVEVLGYNSLHQRVTFGEFMPEEIKSRQNEGVYGSKADVIVDMPSKQPPVERPRRRRKSSDEDELKERERKKSVYEDGKSKNLGCGCMPLGMPAGNHLKWLIILISFSLIAFAVGSAIRLLANYLN
jgi:hypothetical protein